MIKKLLFLFLLFSYISFGETVSSKDTKEINEIVIEYNSYNEISSETAYKDGLKNGNYILYNYKTVKESGVYKNGIKTIYMLNGKPHKKISTVIVDKNEYLIEDYTNPKYSVIKTNIDQKISKIIFY